MHNAVKGFTPKTFSGGQYARVGVGIYVFNEGKILLGKRLGSLGKGTWAVPGGHLEFMETPEECAKRELFEETSLVALSVRKGGWVNTFFPEDKKHYITVFMIVENYSGIPNVKEPDKCAEWDWFSLNNLPEPLFEPLRAFFDDVSLSHLDVKEYLSRQMQT